jgi:hypothetical protein
MVDTQRDILAVVSKEGRTQSRLPTSPTGSIDMLRHEIALDNRLENAVDHIRRDASLARNVMFANSLGASEEHRLDIGIDAIRGAAQNYKTARQTMTIVP